MVQNFQKVGGACFASNESMLTISYHLVQSAIFEVLNTHRSKALVTSDGKEMGL